MKYLYLMIFFLSSGVLYPQDIKMAVPYIGIINSEYKSEAGGRDIDESDSAFMKGLFLQWVRPGRFLVNTFIYHADDLFSETLTGLHFISDLYFGRYVVGAGLELIKPDASLKYTESFPVEIDVETTVTVPFARAGKYFDFDIGKASAFSIFTFAGYQYAVTRGKVNVLLDKPESMGGREEFSEKIKEDKGSPFAGIKLGLNLMRFIDLDFKYSASYSSSEFFNTLEGMANIYFNRNFGVSCRYKYTETVNGSIDYTIFGLIAAF